MMKHSRQLTCFPLAMPLILGILASGPILAEEDVSVTPYRPTGSNPAALSAPGWLEVEIGANRQKPGDGSQQTTLPYQLKYAFSRDFGVLLGGDARMLQVDPDGHRLSGQGDTLLLLKNRWGQGEGDDAPALGLEWGFKSPTAKNGLGSGKTDYIVNSIHSSQIAGNAIDLNLNATRLGSFDSGSGRTQWGWATTLSRPLDERWSIAGELSGIARHGAAATSQALFTLGYALGKRVVLDAGFTVGISRLAPDRSLFFGAAILLEKFR